MWLVLEGHPCLGSTMPERLREELLVACQTANPVPIAATTDGRRLQQR